MPDRSARQQIRERLNETLFVEAGAGSGKTSALVDRIVALVLDGLPMERIAAITFTDRAATELRDRVRHSLEDLARGTDDEASLARTALIELDGAALCTLHSFAQRILIEHPIEAGLPPAVELLDDVSALVDFDERWSETVGELLEDPDQAPILLAVFGLGIRLKTLRKLAREFDANWDLLEQRLAPTPDPTSIDLGRAVADLRAILELHTFCHVPDDSMIVRFRRIETFTDRLEEVALDDAEIVAELRDLETIKAVGNSGNQSNWCNGVEIGDVRTRLKAVAAHLSTERERFVDEVLDRLIEVIGRSTIRAATRRRQQGVLSFHDLLVLARKVLTDSTHGPTVRANLSRRYERLLLDEFQDTDPLQIELAALIADPTGNANDWAALRPVDGSLFFVGDPKQSIYGFRRADISLYLRARAAFGEHTLSLEHNFRTTAPIIDWVNRVFGELIRHEEDAQPEYQPLAAVRERVDIGPSVSLLGADADHSESNVPIRETADIVAAVTTALAEGWTVVRKEKDPAGGPDLTREMPCSPCDIAILVRRKRPVAALAKALGEAGVPHRIEAGLDPHVTDELVDLVTVLRAIDDPTDELALAAALRSPLFGCGDDDLLEFMLAHGRWDHQRPGDHGLHDEHPVVAGMAWLSELHEARRWTGTAEIVERVVRDRRAQALALCGDRPRDTWRRLRTFVHSARTFEEAQGGNLRSFLHWCRLHAADEISLDEHFVPDADDDAVRVLTMHSAKGLEFPICILADLGSGRPTRGLGLSFPDDEGVGIFFSNGVANATHRRQIDWAERLECLERLRLLYVASTRARDHLVVSLHHKTTKSPPKKAINVSSARLLFELEGIDEGAVRFEPTLHPYTQDPPPATTPIPDEDEWNDTLERIHLDGARSRTVAATSLGHAEEPAEEPFEPRRHGEAGRYGTAIGRAVHQALEVTDLRSDGIADARAAAAAEDVDPDAVAINVAAALASPSVQAAAASDHWRELFVAVPLDDELLLEGYVDLVYREGDGLIVVDYKTDAFYGEVELDAKVDRYRLQGGAYTLALERATGLPVHRMTFCFLGDGGATERHLNDLPAAMADAEAAALALPPPD